MTTHSDPQHPSRRAKPDLDRQRLIRVSHSGRSLNAKTSRMDKPGDRRLGSGCALELRPAWRLFPLLGGTGNLAGPVGSLPSRAVIPRGAFPRGGVL
jgi:hypothetical protein